MSIDSGFEGFTFVWILYDALVNYVRANLSSMLDCL